MAYIETAPTERRIRERIRELLADYSDALTHDTPIRRSTIIGEVEGLCFALGVLTGEDAKALVGRLWILGEA